MGHQRDGDLLTAEEAATTLGTEGDWELWDGIAVLCDPAGGPAGPIGAAIGAYLLGAIRSERLGWVGDASTGYLVQRDPDRLLAPDASFVSRERLEVWPVKGFIPCAPDLAVEVRSPSDSWVHVIHRGGIWIAHGVRVVWLVDPIECRAAVLRPATDPVECVGGDCLFGAPVLPALEVDLDALFAVLD